MRSLTNLFRREDRYFALLEASAEEGQASVKEFRTLLHSASAVVSPDKIVQSRLREQEINDEIEELLCRGANPPLDREDVELLARALGGIPRGLKKFAVRYQLCAGCVQDVSFAQQLELLESAVGTVGAMVVELRSPKLTTQRRGTTRCKRSKVRRTRCSSLR